MYFKNGFFFLLLVLVVYYIGRFVKKCRINVFIYLSKILVNNWFLIFEIVFVWVFCLDIYMYMCFLKIFLMNIFFKYLKIREEEFKWCIGIYIMEDIYLCDKYLIR